MIQTLLTHQSHKVTLGGHALGLCNVPASKVAAAHVDNFAFGYQLLHGLPDFFPRAIAVDVMHLIHINVIRLQTLQAGFTGALNIDGRQAHAVRPFSHLAVNFGGDDGLLASIATKGKPTPDDLLSNAFSELTSIDIRGIKEVNPQFERLVHNCVAICFCGVGAKIHCAQAKPTDL